MKTFVVTRIVTQQLVIKASNEDSAFDAAEDVRDSEWETVDFDVVSAENVSGEFGYEYDDEDTDDEDDEY